jgi:16S rRNA (guanine966-N2)-methyltransferase
LARPTRNRVRIIGGRHRGRKLEFPELPGLRPTPDRVRETLFNWLQPVLAGARCLDLFAGSGALGLEAASRGAERVLMLEQAAPAARQLERNRRLLGLDQVEVRQADALRWLRRTEAEPFDIVFLDPPYAAGLQGPCSELLAERAWLSPGALVYLEADSQGKDPAWPADWQLRKRKQAGQVSYCLLQTDVE